MSNTNPTKNGGELRCSGRVSSSCSTSGTRRVNLVKNPVISHEWGKDRKVWASRRGMLLFLLWFSCSQRLLSYLAFKHFGLERTWWRLFQRRVPLSKLYIYGFFLFLATCSQNYIKKYKGEGLYMKSNVDRLYMTVCFTQGSE